MPFGAIRKKKQSPYYILDLEDVSKVQSNTQAKNCSLNVYNDNTVTNSIVTNIKHCLKFLP